MNAPCEPHPLRRSSDKRKWPKMKYTLHKWWRVAAGVFLLFVSVVAFTTAGVVYVQTKNGRAEAARTCARSYNLGPAFTRVYAKGGFTQAELNYYKSTLPKGRTLSEACP